MKTKFGLLIISIALLACCQMSASAQAPAIKKGMIRVAILYPNAEGSTFNMEYYATKHIPLIKKLFGDAMKGASIDKGIASGTPGASVPYLAVGYLYFDNVAAFSEGMKIHAAAIRVDIPNYTNIKPVVQISEVVE